MDNMFTMEDIFGFPMLDEYSTVKMYFSKKDWIGDFKRLPVVGKSNIIAEKHKMEGNIIYSLRDFPEAIQIYTQGLLIADYNSSTYGTIVANISSCLFELKLWEKCIYFIDACLGSDYPKTSRPKLYIRKIKALVNLEEQLHAEESLDHFKDFITRCSISQQEKEKYFQLGEAALNVKGIVSTYREEFLTPDFEENPNVLNICKNAALRCNQQYGRYIVAAKTIKKGECILMEKPYASIGLSRCPNCFKFTKNIIPCKKCPGMLYCSEGCMNDDEIIHKWECSLFKRNTLNLDIRLLIAFRIFLLGLQSGYKSNTTKVEHDFQFGDKNDNFPYIQQLSSKFSEILPTKKILYVEGCCLLLAYISTEKTLKNWISRKMGHDLFMIGKHIMQIIAICDINVKRNVDEDQNYNNQLYPSLSLFNHSCAANTSICFQEDTMVMIALEDINVGQQIFTNYLMGLHGKRMDRVDILSRHFYFNCKCKKCSLECDEEGVMQCPKCKFYVDVEGTHLNCTKCKNVTKLNWETILKMKNFIESGEMFKITNDVSILNTGIKLADELNLNPNWSEMQSLYLNIVLNQIKSGNLDEIHKYLGFIRGNNEYSIFAEQNNVQILKALIAVTRKACLLQNWYAPVLKESTLSELLQHLEYLKEFFLLYRPLKGILKDIEILKAFYNIQNDIIEFSKNNNWMIK